MLSKLLTIAEEKEVRMYGCTVAQMREAVAESLTYRFQGPEFYAFSLMSDAQHEMAIDMLEEARQNIKSRQMDSSDILHGQKRGGGISRLSFHR
jgi:hypothetical protein